MLDLKSTTELNGVMLDLKDEYGLIYYDTEGGGRRGGERRVPAVRPGARSSATSTSDDLYLIGRIVAFQDPQAAHRIPDIAAWDTATGGPYGKAGQWFLDPTDPRARGYALSLAVEACQLGVDEIQFDYVRYPDGLPDTWCSTAGDPETRVATIESFLLEAREVLHPLGCAVAGDIFGFITTARDDGGIGQQWEVVADALDVVSPMLYPSHYSADWYGFAARSIIPARWLPGAAGRHLQAGAGSDHPAVAAGLRLHRRAGARPDRLRPSFGLGWMLWNAFSNVSVDALDPE
jgi:hypothetical protein